MQASPKVCPHLRHACCVVFAALGEFLFANGAAAAAAAARCGSRRSSCVPLEVASSLGAAQGLAVGLVGVAMLNRCWRDGGEPCPFRSHQTVMWNGPGRPRNTGLFVGKPGCAGDGATCGAFMEYRRLRYAARLGRLGSGLGKRPSPHLVRRRGRATARRGAAQRVPCAAALQPFQGPHWKIHL